LGPIRLKLAKAGAVVMSIFDISSPVIEHIQRSRERAVPTFFVYYDAFGQTLALQNAGAMLKPGGLLLTNDRLPVAPGGSMQLAGITVVPYDSPGVSARQTVGWHRKH
jgi:hypothetical protein